MRRVYAADWVLPVDRSPIERGGVAVDGDTIVAVGPADALEGEHVELGDAAILPGLVNAHTHLEYAAFAGFGDGRPFADWLGLHIRRKRELGPGGIAASARLGAALCLASGVTAVGDASYAGVAALACAELGLRATVHLEVFGGEPEVARERFAELRERAAPALGPLVRLGVSPHAPYSTGREVYRAAASLGLPLTTHLAESDHETSFMRDGLGPLAEVAAFAGVDSPRRTSVRELAAAGLLGHVSSAAHCVTVDDEEIELLASNGVGVVHCPRSNALLGCGIAPLAALRAAGVQVALGTDSPASAPSFDLFAEMRSAIELARSRERAPDALAPGSALELATLGGARVLGLDDQIGSLTPGKRADLVAVSLEGTLHRPCEDPVAAVVFSASQEHVLRTIVGGVERYERGGFAWPEVRDAASAARASMLGRALTSS